METEIRWIETVFLHLPACDVETTLTADYRALTYLYLGSGSSSWRPGPDNSIFRQVNRGQQLQGGRIPLFGQCSDCESRPAF